MTLGEKIKKLRKQRKMTQQRLATIIGVSASAVGMYEQNRRTPNYKTLKNIAGCLDVPIESLLNDDATEANATDPFAQVRRDQATLHALFYVVQEKLERIDRLLGEHERE